MAILDEIYDSKFLDEIYKQMIDNVNTEIMSNFRLPEDNMPSNINSSSNAAAAAVNMLKAASAHTTPNYISPTLKPHGYHTFGNSGISNGIIANNHISSGTSFSYNIPELEEVNRKIDDINQRLAILEPNFEKHEKFAALKKAYEHYKMIEKMCYEKDDK